VGEAIRGRIRLGLLLRRALADHSKIYHIAHACAR
jgi:hypothetical protein